ncbi:MAG: serine hydrolase [Sphingopyxis sp.]|uniref:serine hydrolase n=1 Tax=Sphingopyxis sp. TaxID=1908224 RepID=UPI002ABCFB13|nr:serine hydrolase [Sphingopyxis sp.]MDZ3830833.1 serine hydrolase [Sphingopyxis sp.]
MKRIWALVLASTAALFPQALLAQPATETAPDPASPFAVRAAQVVDLLGGRYPYTEFFSSAFQQAIPLEQFQAITADLTAQYGAPLAIESASSADGHAGTLRLRFEKAVGTLEMVVSGGPQQRVEGLRVTDVKMLSDSFAQVSADLAALPGRTAFLVAVLDGEAIHPIAGTNTELQLAIGSTFKLYILDELAAQIAAGRRKWSDVVPLSHLSFSSAATANWPVGTPVTLQTLANWMISVSDNGATDTLIHLLGRDAIEARMRSSGHSDPSRNIPFLTTVEAFALKGNNFADLRTDFLKADDREQRRLIDVNADRLVLANVDGVSFDGKPRFIDRLEWFASATDIARLMRDLRRRNAPAALAAMAINSGVAPGTTRNWSWVGYKGGSEIGVLSMSLLAQRKSDGKWFVVTASWNNDQADVSAETLVAMITRLLALTESWKP